MRLSGKWQHGIYSHADDAIAAVNEHEVGLACELDLPHGDWRLVVRLEPERSHRSQRVRFVNYNLRRRFLYL